MHFTNAQMLIVSTLDSRLLTVEGPGATAAHSRIKCMRYMSTYNVV